MTTETINNQAQYNAYFNTFQHLCYTARHYRSLINPATKKAEQLEKEAEVIRLKLIEYEEREPEY